MPIDEAALRSALRPVFNKFDVDGSGYVSTLEIRQMCTALGMKLSEASLGELVGDANVDKTGEIAFDDFVAATKRQAEAANPSSGGGAEAVADHNFDDAPPPGGAAGGDEPDGDTHGAGKADATVGKA